MGPPYIPHPREEIVKKAERAILDVLEHEAETLTDGEYLRVLATVIDRLGSFAKHMIRAERHPGDPNRPGGWAEEDGGEGFITAEQIEKVAAERIAEIEEDDDD